MANYKGNYRLESKACAGCRRVKEIPTRNKYCSRKCARGTKKEVEAVVTGGPKVLLIDIETFPNLAQIWGFYEQNALSLERHSIMSSVSAKWLNGEQVTLALPDFNTYDKDPWNDYELVLFVWTLLDEADICIAHNGDQFDFKKLNARFIFHGLPPPSPYRTIDTKKAATSYFRFESNRLNELAKFFGFDTKVETGGFKLWQDCMKGIKSAWKLMKEYNAHDVVILEKVYLRMRPWMKNHPNVGMYLIEDTTAACSKCGSRNLEKRGFALTTTGKYQRAQCKDCGGWSRFKLNQMTKSKRTSLLTSL